jgi:hypothetical protein
MFCISLARRYSCNCTHTLHTFMYMNVFLYLFSNSIQQGPCMYVNEYRFRRWLILFLHGRGGASRFGQKRLNTIHVRLFL